MKIPIGTVIGTRTVISYVKAGDRWDVVLECACGTVKRATAANFRRSKSCGCLTNSLISASMRRHGETDSPVWRSWKSMLDRCYLTSHKSWNDYGGRGITVCMRWHVYENFRADMGIRPFGKQLDRIDNSLGYGPGNCKWSTPRENSNNRRNSRYIEIAGEKRTVSQWSRYCGIPRDTFARRIAMGWAPERAISMPVKVQKNNRLSGALAP